MQRSFMISDCAQKLRVYVESIKTSTTPSVWITTRDEYTYSSTVVKDNCEVLLLHRCGKQTFTNITS